ncbi:hypothetical protein TWF481_001426 [Arthrobotrys musiformis]|uniref:Uncharacterized protein n=1 Tax=Arthrobotrys musiformis TaxID=47236 RepID=A0AAV9WQN0_9PEZI
MGLLSKIKSGVKSLFGSGSSKSSSSSSPSISSTPPPPPLPPLSSSSSPSRSSGEDPFDLNKILGGSGNRRGKHHNRPNGGGFSGFAGGKHNGGKVGKHMVKKDITILAAFLGLIAVVIVSLLLFACIAKIRRSRRTNAEKNRNKAGGDVEKGNEQQSVHENVVTDSSTGLDMSDKSYTEEKLHYSGEGGTDLMPPTWGHSENTLSVGTAVATSGSAECSNCAQNGSTVCESCFGGSSAHTPIPDTAIEQESLQIAAPGAWVTEQQIDPNPAGPSNWVPENPSPADTVLPTVLPEVQVSTTPFVDASDTIGLADGGPIGTAQTTPGEFNANDIINLN